MTAALTLLLSGIGRRVSLWAGLTAAIVVAFWILLRRGRHEAAAELAFRQADARIRSMQTSRETRHDVQNADRTDLEHRADRWMRD